VGTLFHARRRIVEGFDHWAAEALDYWRELDDATANPETPPTPPALALRVGTGLGKSRQARRTAVELVRTLRAAGNMRPVVLSVPRHDLAEETAQDLRAIAGGLRVAVWRGRGAEDPGTGAPMCERSAEADAISKAGLKVSENLCRRRLPDGTTARCPFYDRCAYLAQSRAEADIWILTHPLLFMAPPKAIGEPGALVIDEDCTGAAVGNPRFTSLHDLAREDLIEGDLTGEESADLATLKKRLARALAECRGKVAAAAFRNRLTLDDLAEGERLAWRLKVSRPEIDPRSTPEEIAREIARIAPINARAMNTAATFATVREALQAGHKTVPGLAVIERETKEGERYLAARLRRGRRLHARWNVPAVIADATLQPELLRCLFPGLREIIEAEAAAPFVTVRQVIDRTFSALSVCPDPEKSGAERLRHAARTRGRILRYIEARAWQMGCAPADVLVVGQKAAIELLRAEGLPEGVQTAHFGATAGLDRWRAVRLIIVIGRTAPSPQDIEDLAEALGRRPVECVAGWYDRAPGALNMRGAGAGPAVYSAGARGQDGTPGTDRHPDRLADAWRWQKCEGELMQTLGRGRGVNRTAEDPLQIDLLTNVPLPIAVDEAATFESFEPTPAALMAARGVLVPDTAAKGAWHIVAAIVPDLYPSAEAARDAGKERSRGENPYKIYYGLPPRESGAARIRLAGARYAVPVQIRARSEAEARDLLARVLPGAELLSFDPPPVPEAERWAEIRRDVLAVALAEGEPVADARLRAVLAEAANDDRAGTDARATALWWRAGWWRDAVAAS
jgi:putative DNA primase/helicase